MRRSGTRGPAGGAIFPNCPSRKASSSRRGSQRTPTGALLHRAWRACILPFTRDLACRSWKPCNVEPRYSRPRMPPIVETSGGAAVSLDVAIPELDRSTVRGRGEIRLGWPNLRPLSAAGGRVFVDETAQQTREVYDEAIRRFRGKS